MKSEILYEYSSYWRGHWGDEHGTKIVIASCFDNPAVWPFTIKRYDIDIDDDTYEEHCKESLCVRLPIDVFEKIKNYIEENSALRACENHIRNAVMDGSDDSFYFGCDSYTKRTGGSSVLLCGSFEAEGPERERTGNYVIKVAVDAIEKILNEAGIELN